MSRFRWLRQLVAAWALICIVACASQLVVPLSTSPAPPLAERSTAAVAQASVAPRASAVASIAATPAQSAAPVVTATAVQPSPAIAEQVTATAVPATATASPVPATQTAAPSPTQAPTAEPALPPIDPQLAAELQQILDRTVADGYIPGATISVVVPGRQPWSGASGIADRASGAPMQPDTRVRIASISKIFTAVVVLQLVQEGTINLDAPIESYLPGVVPRGGVVTVRNLLNHTSGLYDYLEDRSFLPQAYQDPARLWNPGELVDYAAQFPLAFAPGAAGAWDYSSTNYVILGMLVEQVTGSTLAAEMRARIFDPLELTTTFFAPDEPVNGAQAGGYSRNVDQSEVAMSWVYATANLVSTPDDVRRFILALTGGELLAPATLEQMYGWVDGNGQYNMPQLEYGLGIMRNVLPVGAGRPAEASRVVGHIGGFGGFRSAVWTAPASGITVALGVNQASTDPNILATEVFDALLRSQNR